MKTLSMYALILAPVGMAAPASAGVVTLGSGFARSCYEASENRDLTRDAFESCDRALNEQALDRHDEVATHVNRGILFYLSGNLTAADRDYDEALRLNAREPEAWLNKGLAALKAGDDARAMPMFAKALDYRTTRPAIAWYGRSIVHENRGQVREAYAALNKARALAPAWKLPIEELKRYQIPQR
ncbi:MAG: tetratricopeptide repeat protein [Sphingomicrobium sp.]|nr:hypothetical protein [Sphingomonadales bacterium]